MINGLSSWSRSRPILTVVGTGLVVVGVDQFDRATGIDLSQIQVRQTFTWRRRPDKQQHSARNTRMLAINVSIPNFLVARPCAASTTTVVRTRINV